MPTFVYMTSCDGCGYCVDICPSDIMHIDTAYRRAFNIEPNMCWECYACVKALRHRAAALDVRLLDTDDLKVASPVSGLVSGAAPAHSATDDENVRVDEYGFTAHYTRPFFRRLRASEGNAATLRASGS